MPSILRLGRARLRETASPDRNGEWPLSEIFNRELYPAIRRMIAAFDDLLGVEVFDLVGASHTLLQEHVLNYVRVSHSSVCTLTIPPDSDGPFGPGDWFRGIQSGAGALTIVEGSGVVINKPETLVMYKQWGTFTLVHTNAANTWDFDGDAELA